MIATDQQYRTTSDRLGKFRIALAEVERDQQIAAPFRSVRTQALKEQIANLEMELKEYDELRSGQVREIAVQSFADLPIALVKARIARGLSQSALAELIGVKPQQVQRWEADGYSRVGFENLRRIAGELRVKLPRGLSLEGNPPMPPSAVRRAMVAAGLPREVFERSVLPSPHVKKDDFVLADEIDARVHVLFGTAASAMQDKAAFERTALRFKLPASARQTRTRAYAAYVNGICGIVAKCLPHLTRRVPEAWDEMRTLLFANRGPTLRGALEACWTAGIAVIALDDPVAFHGACWRRENRTVIVLKQSVTDEFRWLFDLIHELFHVVAAPDGDFTVIEADETSVERRESQEEKRASRFAAEVLTDGRLRELTDSIVSRAQGFAPRLKAATLKVAEEADLPAGLLANLLAHRLAEDSGNDAWWPTAAALQSSGDSPWKIVRDVFLERAEINVLSRVERDIVLQLMETRSE